MKNYNSVPQSLKKLPNWVCYQLAMRDGKKAKIPINPKTGRFAKANDFYTWTDFDRAATASSKYDGIGFEFTGSGFTGIDLDHCRKPDGSSVDWALKLLNQLPATYIEISPSGDGYHLFFNGQIQSSLNLRGLPDCNGGHHAGIEAYDQGRFFTVTGWGGGAISLIPKNLICLLQATAEEYSMGNLNQNKKDNLPSSPMINYRFSQRRTLSFLQSTPQTPRAEARLRNQLQFISADCSYEVYRDIVWGIISTGWSCAAELAEEWSKTSPHRFSNHCLSTLIKSYDANRPEKISIGTIVFYAKQGGWHD